MYTVGDLAKEMGISVRTVRFYDEKGILRPAGYSQAGYRIYDENSVEKLQKILMLRFLDFWRRLFADAELFLSDDGAVAGDVFTHEVVKQTTTLTYQHLKSALCCMILVI